METTARTDKSRPDHHHEAPFWRWLSRAADIVQLSKIAAWLGLALIVVVAALLSVLSDVALPTALLLLAAGIVVSLLLCAIAMRFRLNRSQASSVGLQSRPSYECSPTAPARTTTFEDLRPIVWNCDSTRYERLGNLDSSDAEAVTMLAEQLLEGEKLLSRTSQLLFDLGRNRMVQLLRGPETTEQDILTWEKGVADALSHRAVSRARFLSEPAVPTYALGVGRHLATMENPLWRRMRHRLAMLTAAIEEMERR